VIKRAFVTALEKFDEAIDTVLYRPAVVSDGGHEKLPIGGHEISPRTDS
jgi:hypothetical protein